MLCSAADGDEEREREQERERKKEKEGVSLTHSVSLSQNFSTSLSFVLQCQSYGTAGLWGWITLSQGAWAGRLPPCVCVCIRGWKRGRGLQIVSITCVSVCALEGRGLCEDSALQNSWHTSQQIPTHSGRGRRPCSVWEVSVRPSKLEEERQRTARRHT